MTICSLIFVREGKDNLMKALILMKINDCFCFWMEVADPNSGFAEVEDNLKMSMTTVEDMKCPVRNIHQHRCRCCLRVKKSHYRSCSKVEERKGNTFFLPLHLDEVASPKMTEFVLSPER